MANFNFTVTSETGSGTADLTGLNNVIAAIDQGGTDAAVGNSYTVMLGGNFTLSRDLLAVNLDAGASLSVVGAGHTIDGGHTVGTGFRGFLVFAGDVIDAAGFQGGSASFDPSTKTLTFLSDASTLALTLDAAYTPASFGSANDAAGTGLAVTYTACYAAGTRIATARGEVPVEALRPGDRVVSAFGGTAPVVWLGHRRLDCRRHPKLRDVWPVRVRAGAFAPGRPRRDLLLSPDHALFIDEVLIPVRHLINATTVVQERVNAIDYWHVELPAHDVILAEGTPAESYLDTGNRAAFDNGGTEVQLHADFALRVWDAEACAGLVVSGPRLVAVRGRLLARAAALGYRLTTDAEPRLVADGRLITPMRGDGGVRFGLATTPQRLLLISRSAVPAEVMPASDDHRRLGICVTRLVLDGREIGLDDPRLSRGWHAAEPGFRWTDGAAHLPPARTVSVTPLALLHYPSAQSTPAAAA
jgi:hypothetical protein